MHVLRAECLAEPVAREQLVGELRIGPDVAQGRRAGEEGRGDRAVCVVFEAAGLDAGALSNLLALPVMYDMMLGYGYFALA